MGYLFEKVSMAFGIQHSVHYIGLSWDSRMLSISYSLIELFSLDVTHVQ